MLNGKLAGVTRQHIRVLFGHSGNARRARAALELRAQRAELFALADGIDLHAAVGQVLHVPGHAQKIRDALGEKAKSNTLHHSGDVKSLGLKRLGHSRRAILPEVLPSVDWESLRYTVSRPSSEGRARTSTQASKKE